MTKTKGWTVFTSEPIAIGTFVCEYAGEILRTPEALERLDCYDHAGPGKTGHALLVVREVMPSRTTVLRINIDATRIGNVARFINHSCDGGNLAPLIVRMAGSILPRVCLYARRGIEAGEELSFAYGEPRALESDGGEIKSRPRACRCGTAACKGLLPSMA